MLYSFFKEKRKIDREIQGGDCLSLYFLCFKRNFYLGKKMRPQMKWGRILGVKEPTGAAS